jgi:hypothetical protein
MAKNGIVTTYDDLGYPTAAAATVGLTFAGGVVKASPGRLLKVVVTTAFVTAGTLTFYDSTSAASGTVLLAIPQASGTVGAIFTLDVPSLKGIFAASTGLTAGAVTVGFS